MVRHLVCGFTIFLCEFALPASAQIAIDTTDPSDWKIANSAITLDWNSTTGNVFGVYLNGHPDNLTDPTVTSHGQPRGLYMDNTGLGSGTSTSGYYNGGSYLDWWITTPSNSANAFTYSEHFIIGPSDSGFHAYFVATHSASDIAGTLGQIQYVFRISQTLFTNTHSVNSGLNNLGATDIALPAPPVLNTTDPGRQVQDATVDLHGLPLPAGFGRQFYTKYDYSSYEYLHQAHGLYGSTYGAWTVIPSTESLAGGPTKQDLIFTGNILMMECLSGHLDNALNYVAPQGVASNRLFGPYYFHFNAFENGIATPADMYADALSAASGALAFYDNDTILAENGYVSSNARGTVAPSIFGAGTAQPNTSWLILSDDTKNYQYSSSGSQYWAANNSGGTAPLPNVAPGSYRLSGYVLGQWGELRRNAITVAAGQTTNLNLAFTPENFGIAPPIWTVGTPDRSAHEFLHGEDGSGQDDREFWGNWNYWADFAATNGAVIYYATPVGSTPPTNDLSKWNYVQWQSFNPGLYAGIYNPSDDTTDGYKYIAPSYVNPATAQTPPWQIHFTTTAAQQTQGQYVIMSVGLAAAEGSLIVTLNGHQLIWHATKASDPMVRSGLSGTYQSVVFQWDASQLNAPGQDNVIALSVNRQEGVMYDALRMEITNASADPANTGWNDYEYLYGSTDKPANDALPSNGTPVSPRASSDISTTASGLVYSRVTQRYSGTVTVTNLTSGALNGPFEILVNSLPPGVSLTNTSGTYAGNPYLTIPGFTTLAPGQSATVAVEFANSSNTRITFQPITYAATP